MTEDAIVTAQSWMDAEDEWREMAAELYGLGRPLSPAEQEDLDLAAGRVRVARDRHVSVIRVWARTQ